MCKTFFTMKSILQYFFISCNSIRENLIHKCMKRLLSMLMVGMVLSMSGISAFAQNNKAPADHSVVVKKVVDHMQFDCIVDAPLTITPEWTVIAVPQFAPLTSADPKPAFFTLARPPNCSWTNFLL